MLIRPVRLWGLLLLWFAGGAALGFVGSRTPRIEALRRAEKAEQERDEAREEAAAFSVRVMFSEGAQAIRQIDQSNQVPSQPVPRLRGGLTLATRAVSPFFIASFGAKRELFDGRLEWEHDNDWGLLLGVGRDTEKWETLIYAITPTSDADRLADQIGAAELLVLGFAGGRYYDGRRHWVAEAIETVSRQGASVVDDFGPTRATLAFRGGVYVLGLESTGLEPRTAGLRLR